METWFWIVGWFLSILTTTGNGFIIFLVCRKRQLHTKTNAFVVSLAVADFCVGMTVVPSLFLKYKTSIHHKLQTRLPGGTEFVRWTFMVTSVTNLCNLVLDRFIAVAKPLKYLTFMTRRRVMQMILFSWATPSFFILLESTIFRSLNTSLIINTFFWLVIIFYRFLPCLMLIFCFLSMIRIVYQQDRAARILAKQLRFNHRVLFKSHEKSAVVMMGIVIGMFLVCSGIYLHCGLVRVLSDKISCNDLNYKIPILILNSAVNALAYAFLKRDIKKESERLYKAIFRRGNKVKPFSEDNRFILGSTTL